MANTVKLGSLNFPKLMRHVGHRTNQVRDLALKEREELRKKEGRSHEVFYFHELLDPYSHITAQLITKFTS